MTGNLVANRETRIKLLCVITQVYMYIYIYNIHGLFAVYWFLHPLQVLEGAVHKLVKGREDTAVVSSSLSMRALLDIMKSSTASDSTEKAHAEQSEDEEDPDVVDSSSGDDSSHGGGLSLAFDAPGSTGQAPKAKTSAAPKAKPSAAPRRGTGAERPKWSKLTPSGSSTAQKPPPHLTAPLQPQTAQAQPLQLDGRAVRLKTSIANELFQNGALLLKHTVFDHALPANATRKDRDAFLVTLHQLGGHLKKLKTAVGLSQGKVAKSPHSDMFQEESKQLDAMVTKIEGALSFVDRMREASPVPEEFETAYTNALKIGDHVVMSSPYVEKLIETRTHKALLYDDFDGFCAMFMEGSPEARVLGKVLGIGVGLGPCHTARVALVVVIVVTDGGGYGQKGIMGVGR